MKIVNLSRGLGKTFILANWVKGNLEKRCAMVSLGQQKRRLISYGVPERNIIRACNYGKADTSGFEEIGIDEVDKVLEIMLDIKVSMITGTSE